MPSIIPVFLTSIMAPNLAHAQLDMLHDMLSGKSQGEHTLTDAQIAEAIPCSTRTVRHARSNLLLYGSTRAPSNGGGRPSSISPLMLTALFDELDRDPCMCQRDMASFLSREFKVTVSHDCIGRALRKAGWSKKATQNVAKEQNVDLREEHIYELSHFRSYQLVFIDESGMDKSIGTMKKGYARRGRRPRQVKKFHRGRRVQVLSALGQDGVIHFRVYEESTDTEIFKDFIKELLPYCGRWPEPRSVLVVDNASFHRSEEIQRMCDEAGVVYKLQSPYSPDLNPIEEHFGETKNFMRKIWNKHEKDIKYDFASFVERCVEMVGEREDSARGHFRRAGISIDEPPE